MLHDDSLASLLTRMLSDKVEDPLSYQDYPFDMDDWANIPSLVPKYIIHLNNHLKALIRHNFERSKEETTLQLRTDMVNQLQVSYDFDILSIKFSNQKIPVVYKLIIQQRDNHFIETIAVNNKQHDEIQNNVKDLRRDADNLIANQNKDKEDKVKQSSQLMSQLFNPKDPQEFLNEFESNGQDGFICDTQATRESRYFSIYQIRQLINFGLQKSKLNQRVTSTESAIDIIRMQLSDLMEWKLNIEKTVSSNKQEANQLNDKTNALLLQNFEQLTKRCSELSDKLKQHTQKLSKHQELHEEDYVFKEVLSSKLDIINDRISKVREQSKEELELNSKNFLSRLEDGMMELNTALHQTKKDMDRLKLDVTDILELKNEQAINHMETVVAKIENEFNDLKGMHTKFRDDLIKKNKQRVTKIKDICSKYFEKTDKLVQKNAESVQGIEQTFENWKMTTLKPSQVAEARLFAIETQLSEMENERIAEYQYTKDIIRKLIFALESHQQRQWQDILSTAQSQSPSQYLNISSYDDQDPQSQNQIIYSNNANQNRVELPNLQTLQPKFQFGNPSDTNYNSSSITPIMNPLRRHSQSRKMHRLQDNSSTSFTDRNGYNNLFRQRLNFIKSALDQDSILIPQIKHKIPLKHTENKKLSYTQETSINDSQMDKSLLENIQHSLSDNLGQDSIITNDAVIETIKKPRHKSKLSQLSHGKVSPQNMKIQSLLQNTPSLQKQMNNPLNKYKMANYGTYGNVFEASDNFTSGYIDIQGAQSSLNGINNPEPTAHSFMNDMKTNSTFGNGFDSQNQGQKPQLISIYNHVDKVDATLKEQSLRFEQELNQKSTRKNLKGAKSDVLANNL